MFQWRRWIFILTLFLWGFTAFTAFSLGRRPPFVQEESAFQGMEKLWVGGVFSGEQVVFEFNGRVLSFTRGSRLADVDGVRVWLHEGFRFEGGEGWLHPADKKYIMDPLCLEDVRCSLVLSKDVVVLDAGHGGENQGAVSPSGLLEKERALVLCRKVAALLRKSKVEVRLTRVSDVALPLARRGAVAKELGADVFVSIHLNKSSNTGASGIETFCLTEPGLRSSNGSTLEELAGVPKDLGLAHRVKNTQLGYALQRSLVKNGDVVDRGLKRARFRVLRDAPCPAALVECGFLSHVGEEKLFASEEYMDYIAGRIAEGILFYLAR